jgi:hypothetical protein
MGRSVTSKLGPVAHRDIPAVVHYAVGSPTSIVTRAGPVSIVVSTVAPPTSSWIKATPLHCPVFLTLLKRPRYAYRSVGSWPGASVLARQTNTRHLHSIIGPVYRTVTLLLGS